MKNLIVFTKMRDLIVFTAVLVLTLMGSVAMATDFFDQVFFYSDTFLMNSGTGLHGPGVDNSYFIFTARDNGVGGVEVARVQGAADPYFKAGSAVFLQSGGVSISGNLKAKTGRTATFVVAASNALASSKDQADYVCDGTNDQVEIQSAIDAIYNLGAGGGLIQLTEGYYNLSIGLSFPSSGIRINGQGKSATTLILVADITPFGIVNLNDVEVSNLLVMASGSQTNPIINLTANNAVIARNNFRSIQLTGGAANTFTAIQLYASGSGGVWNCTFNDISVSGVGTVVGLNCQAALAWINYNRFENFYVNDFVVGIDIVHGGGAGSNGNRFSNWAMQCGARTTFGLRIPDSPDYYNYDTMLYAVDFVDMPASGKYFSLGTGVRGTKIIGGTSEYSASKYVDKGIKTQIITVDDYIAKLTAAGNLLHIPTLAGWTQVRTGSGATTQQISYNVVRTGTTSNSNARLYTSAPLFGFSNALFTSIDYSKELILIFNYARSVSATSAIARVQMKNATTEGALAGVGLGIKVANFALYGESYGSSGQEVNLSTTLNADQTVQIMIIFYPGSRIEWWVDGLLKATQATADYLPTGTVTSNMVHSILTSGQTVDAQSYLMQPKLWQAR